MVTPSEASNHTSCDNKIVDDEELDINNLFKDSIQLYKVNSNHGEGHFGLY